MLDFIKENIEGYLGLDSHRRITETTKRGNPRKWTGSYGIWEERLEAYKGKLEEITRHIA